MTIKTDPEAAPGFARKPNYPLVIKAAGGRCLAHLKGRVLADSNRALILEENSYPPVVYFPQADVVTTLIKPSSTTSFCPYKGHASYFSATTENETIEDIGWFYPMPYREVATIKNHVAFYPKNATVTRLP